MRVPDSDGALGEMADKIALPSHVDIEVRLLQMEGEGLFDAPARFEVPSHRMEPRLLIIREVIPRLFSYDVHGISFLVFLNKNIIRSDAFSFAPARTPKGFGRGRLRATDFVSHQLK